MPAAELQMNGRGLSNNISGLHKFVTVALCGLLAGALTFVLQQRVHRLWSGVLISVIFGATLAFFVFIRFPRQKHDQRLLNRLTDAGLIAVYCWNHQGRVTYANNAALKMFGRRVGEMSTLGVKDIIVPIERTVMSESGSSFETRTFIGHLIRRHGHPLPVFSGAARLAGQKEDYVGFAIDISSDREAQAAAPEIRGHHGGACESVRHLYATILLVEDQQPLRELLNEVLTSAGFRVLEAKDGRHAVEIAAAYEGTIDLMLTDWVMPGMDGGDAAVRVRQKRPGIKVVYMSGYSEEVVTNGLPSPHGVFLEKPVRPDVLINNIRTVLNNEIVISSNGKARAA